MLQLAVATDPEWAERVLPDLDEVLVDHAHLEKKAAAAAVNLLFRYPDWRCLQEPLSRLAREELQHFEQVLRMLEARGVAFGRQRPSPYFGKLHRGVRSHEPERLLDLLLCAGLIEARSCERLGLLAEAVTEPGLRALYRGLLAAEARHHGIYLELARRVAGRARADARLQALAAHEARVLAGGPARARLHDAGRQRGTEAPG